jgi:alkylated DNA repair dioxygenase AlkB
MSVLHQDSLFDLDGEPSFEPLAPARTPLTSGAWVDVQHGWLAGSAPVFESLLNDVPWRAERRRMYEQTVDVPRLLCFYGPDAPLPSPVLSRARSLLNAYYPGPFTTAGMCLYRDGHDSVAWHGDTIGRGMHEDVLVAILSLGAPRALALRPRAGGPSRRFELGHGDLIVMGGSCQRTWEHAIPKTARSVGPRISIQFRPADVR